MTGFHINDQKEGEADESEKDTWKPLTANEAEPGDREKEFLTRIISRMNDLFGDVSDDQGQRHFTAQVADIAKNHARVSEQIDKNTKEQALHGDLPEVAKKAAVDAMQSHDKLARTLLKDSQNMNDFYSLIYDIVKHGKTKNLIE